MSLSRIQKMRFLQSSISRQINTFRCMSFQAVNEPILSFTNSSPERAKLEAKLKEYKNKVFDVPIVIGDKEIRNSKAEEQVKPFDHKSPVAKFYYATKEQIQEAISVSLEAHREWERKPLEERAAILLRAGDLVAGKYRYDLLAATMLGQAKTIVQAEIDAACELADFYRFDAQWALDLKNWQPIGLDQSRNQIDYRACEGFWAAIAPFNFTAIGGHLSGAPALMGNTVLWKPSDTAVLSSYISFQVLREAGVPAGVINFLPADGPVFGSTVTDHPMLAGINFTGSAATFSHLWKEVGSKLDVYRSFPRLIGECGGKNFHMVHPTADIQDVIYGTVRSAFEYGGQKCSACSRLYVPKSRWSELKDGLTEQVKNIKVGTPLSSENFLSAVIDKKAFDRIKGYINHAKSSSDCTIIQGGNCDDSEGYYIEPTIIVTSNPKDKLLQEEIFGPVLTVYVYEDADFNNTLDLINTTSPFALTGAIYSGDEQVIDHCKDVLRYAAGNFYINDKSTGSIVSQQPFGGARKSGTNDKAGSPHYLLKFVSPLSIKRTTLPLNRWDYPYMKN